MADPNEKKDLTGLTSLPAETMDPGSQGEAASSPEEPPKPGDMPAFSAWEPVPLPSELPTSAAPAEPSPPATYVKDTPDPSLPPAIPPPQTGFSERIESFESIEELSQKITPAGAKGLGPELTEIGSSGPDGPGHDSMDAVKKFSENMIVGKPVIQAAFPFSLMITGKLTPHEKQKLTDLLSKENMGIHETDLEPQFQNDKILIPRISEYAGVLIVQALRGTRAHLKLAPSDSVFFTADTRQGTTELEVAPTPVVKTEYEIISDDSVSHPAETLPITSDSELPGFPGISVIDTITASAALKSTVVEAETSTEYQQVIDALQRELKYKAYRRGAIGIIRFSVQLIALNLPTHYRLTVTGTAVAKARENSQELSPETSLAPQ